MKFLVITQDLRISGTSQGIIERSFLTKLKKVYPNSVIDVLYISHFDKTNNQLDKLPVDSISTIKVNHTIPFHIKWINRFATRFFNCLVAENFIHRRYAKHIKKIDYTIYDQVFIRSAGLKHETILAMHKLPILEKSIINFHDPYPYSWYAGKASNIHKNEYLRLKKVIDVVQQAKVCCASAYYMAKDLQYLYASDKYFYTIPHYYESDAFDLNHKEKLRKKAAKLQIAYHGALMFGRNILNVLEAYTGLIQENPELKNNTEFILRVKGDGIKDLKTRFAHINHIEILETLDFSNSANEQIYESDINIILENGPYYCNILPGKVPFLASIGKPVLVVSPERSELRRILNNNEAIIANMNSVDDIKLKLNRMIMDVLENKEFSSPFGDYFSDEAFKKRIDEILEEKI